MGKKKKIRYAVRRYEDLEEFEKGLNAEFQAGWTMHSWQDSEGHDGGWNIVVVYTHG